MPEQQGPAVELDAPHAFAPGMFDGRLAGFGWGMVEPEGPIERQPAVGRTSPYGITRLVVYPPTLEGWVELEFNYEQTHSFQVCEVGADTISQVPLCDASDARAYGAGGFVSADEAAAIGALREAVMADINDVVLGDKGEPLDASPDAVAIAASAFRALVPAPGRDGADRSASAFLDGAEAMVRDAVGEAARALRGGKVGFADAVDQGLALVWRAYQPLRTGCAQVAAGWDAGPVKGGESPAR